MVGRGEICNYHLSHLLLFDDVEFAGFMDIRREKAVEKAEKAGNGKVYDNYATMLDDAKPDVLYICVSPDQHGFIEFEAIKRRIPFKSPYADACKSLALTLAYNESIRTGKEIILDQLLS